MPKLSDEHTAKTWHDFSMSVDYENRDKDDTLFLLWLIENDAE